MTRVEVRKSGEVDVQSGFRELRLCKTTQSGYEGFHRDQYTLLPDTKERLMASSVTCTWSYFGGAQDYDMEYKKIRQKLVDAFFGTPKSGVYSPSVQKTLYEKGESVIDGCPEVEWIMVNMPYLHFNPLHPVASKFEHDVYFPTSEPHGTIEAVVQRRQRARLRLGGTLASGRTPNTTKYKILPFYKIQFFSPRLACDARLSLPILRTTVTKQRCGRAVGHRVLDELPFPTFLTASSRTTRART